MDMSTVSIIIATYSRPHLLPRAIESAFAAGRDVEVVVVDDASTDNTAEVVRQFSNVRYVRLDRNQRVAGARNVGIMASTGEYVSFLDDDDIRLPGSIDTQVQALISQPDAGMVYGRVIVGDENGVPTELIEPEECSSGDIFWRLLGHSFIHCLSAVFRRKCLTRVGLLDQSLPGMDDWDLWVRISELYPVAVVDQAVGVWRNFTPGSDQGSARIAALFKLASRVQVEKWFNLPRAASAPIGLRETARQQLLDRFSDTLIWHAATELPKGYSEHARTCIRTALSLNPGRAMRPWTFLLLAQTLLPRERQDKSPTTTEGLRNREAD
jgi:glycosyltransferase involved in cell wall biosynthesis